MVHVLDPEVGPKGRKNTNYKNMLLLAATNNIHGRKEGWFNWPTSSTDPTLPYRPRYGVI